MNPKMKHLSTTKFIFLISLINLTLYHFPFYGYVFSHLSMFSLNGFLTLFAVSIALMVVTLLIFFILALISIKILKLFTIFMMIGNAIALYFVVTYHVILDKTMMGNVFNTDIHEAISFYHPKLLLYLLFLGILPAYFIAKIGIRKPKRIRLLIQLIGICTLGIFIMYLNASTWLWIDKNAKKLGALSMPWSYTINAIRYQLKQWRKNKKQILLPHATFKNNNKILVVLVIGESARANNFSLYGYNKKTNPYLEKLHVIALKPAVSTATYTTASVNSMLSYKGLTSDTYEVLPSYLQREGVEVIWRTNNWGEPTMKVETYQNNSDLQALCQGEGCQYDEVLLSKLGQRIQSAQKNKIFVVLHTAGSHGPTYYKKYPKSFEHFQPVCKTVDLKTCSRQELINTYDNTIIYTDYFLKKTIDILKKQHIPSMMIYASDHGESLGEYGLYLHGTPYTIAPDVQKNIPMILWLSPKLRNTKALKSLSSLQAHHYSHHNIFHTILGAFGMHSSIYNQKLDIFQ